MKRHKWTDIKARTKPETRRRIETEARRLSKDLHLSQLRKARELDSGKDGRTAAMFAATVQSKRSPESGDLLLGVVLRAAA